MPYYDYVARDSMGNVLTGVQEATDRSELRSILRAGDLYLTRFKVASAPGGKASFDLGGLFAPKPTLQDLVVATRQIGATVRSGLPIVEALGIVGSQSNKPPLRDAFTDIQQGVIDGQTLSVGMMRHPALFSPLVVALVEAGELSGMLDRTLDLASESLDREDTLRRRVKAATLYPKLVAAACVGTIAVMLLIIVPVFSNVYRGLHATLPLPTRLLLSLSAAVVHWWWLIALAGFAGSRLVKRYVGTDEGRRNLDRLVLKVPVLGPVMQKVAIARSVQTLAGSLRAGVPVLNALSIAAGTAGNSVVREAVESAAQGVRDGAAIAPELEKTGQFPLLATRMIAAGESTGNIDAMLEEVNRFYERDIDDAVGKLTRSIEPMMTLLMGGIVLLVLLALYMPIFSLGAAMTGKK